MFFYYLIRRIPSVKSEHHDLCQVVAYSTTEKGISKHLDLVHEHTKVPPGTCYTIEKHPPNLSGRDLEQAYALSKKIAEERNLREADEAYRNKVETARQERYEHFQAMKGEEKPRKVTIVH